MCYVVTWLDGNSLGYSMQNASVCVFSAWILSWNFSHKQRFHSKYLDKNFQYYEKLTAIKFFLIIANSVVHLVRSQNFPKILHFLPPDTALNELFSIIFVRLEIRIDSNISILCIIFN